MGPGSSFTLYMPVGVPGDEGVRERNHTPSGIFWESLLKYLVTSKEPTLANQYEADSESDTLCLLTDNYSVADKLRELLSPYVADEALTKAIIAEADGTAFEFDE